MFDRQHAVGFQVLRRSRVQRRRGERHPFRLGRHGEQVHQGLVLPVRDELGLHVQAEFPGQQPALRRHLPGPGGAGNVPGHHIAGRGRAAGPGYPGQPATLLRGGRHRADQVVRGPGVRVDAEGAALQHGAHP